MGRRNIMPRITKVL